MEKPKWLIPNKIFFEHECFEVFWEENGFFCEEYSWHLAAATRFPNLDYTDCPICGEENINYEIENTELKNYSYRWKCKKCNHKFSVISGTFLENTKLSLAYWFRLFYYLGDLRKEVNSCKVAEDLGVTQKTAYNMLIKIRDAVNISGKTEVDGINFCFHENTDGFKLQERLLSLKNQIQN